MNQLTMGLSEIQQIRAEFAARFGAEPVLYSAPGRINLIGEHTDYNDGFVLPAAIDRTIEFGMQLNERKLFRFYSIDYDEYYETDQVRQGSFPYGWVSYLLGVIAQFLKEGVPINGVDCVFGGNIPVGSGLSSSAAIECGYALGLNDLLGTNLSRKQLALMAQLAEHEYAGVMCGIMDQYASLFGREGEVLRLDCRELEHSYYPLSLKDDVIVLCDTKVKHQLADSAYNTRREECGQGVALLQRFDPSIRALRDASEKLLQEYRDAFDPVVFRRCQYVVKENQRVREACVALSQRDFRSFGELMYLTHEGLRHDYEVSCTELDILVDLTREMDFVTGARMMGGGFGGCTINLVRRSRLDEFENRISEGYQKATGALPELFTVEISNGAKVLH